MSMEWLLSSYLRRDGEKATEAMGICRQIRQRRDATKKRDEGGFFPSRRNARFASDWAPPVGAFVADQRERTAGEIFWGVRVIGAYLMSAVGVFSAAVIAPLLALVVAMSVA